MGLREILLSETASRRLPLEEIRGRFRVHQGDQFNSSAVNLVDGNSSLRLEKALLYYKAAGWFLPDLLSKGVLGLVSIDEAIEPDTYYKYKVTDVLNLKMKDIDNIFIARPIRKSPDAKSVMYSDSRDAGAAEPNGMAQIAQRRVNQGLVETSRNLRQTTTGSNLVDRLRNPIQKFADSGFKGSGLLSYEVRSEYPNAMKKWVTVDKPGIGVYPILADENHSYNPSRRLRQGDLFSAILMAYSDKSMQCRNHRIFQFAQNNQLGYVDCFDLGFYDVKPLPKQQMKVGFVYRFEVTKIRTDSLFNCKAIELLSDESAADVNYIEEDKTGLSRRQKIDFTVGGCYRVGVANINEGKNSGVFYDSLHPDVTGVIFFQSPQQARTALHQWVTCHVTRIAGTSQRKTLYADFLKYD